jgi:nucleotide-binding universal stress UspA family protein
VAVGENGIGQAVDWAAAEASARRCALHVVHVEPLRWGVDPSGLVPAADFGCSRAAAEDLLKAAMARARSVASDIEVSARLVFGSTVPVLASQCRGARLLVLDSSRHATRSRRGLMVPSACTGIARRAGCPVVVVGRLQSGPSVALRPRIVVGVDRTGSCTAALAFAFSAAEQRGLPLTAVHAWAPDYPADLEAVSGSIATSEAIARTVLDRVLAPWQATFEGVGVEARPVCGDPAAALIRESEGAALVVVGSRGRGTVRAAVLGSVSRSVTRQARCPAVVVRADRTVKDKAARASRRTVVPMSDRTGTGRVQRRRTPWE